MDVVTSLPAFLLAVVMIWAVPGPAMLLVIRRAALGGVRTAMATVLGLGVGLYAWALAAAAGLGALVTASEVAYGLLRIVGAVFLIIVGSRSLRAAWRQRRGPDPVLAAPVSRRSTWGAFGEGVAVQAANPKIAVFMLAFYPQFIPATSAVLPATAVLALIQVAAETCLYAAVLAGVGRAGAWLQRASVRQWLEGVSGAVLIALGVRVAASSR